MPGTSSESTRTGRPVGRVAGRHLQKVSLEHGSKNSLILFDDADLDLAVPDASWSVHLHDGRTCARPGARWCEQMDISGGNGVKAYRESASGDNGYLLTAAMNYALPGWGGAVHSIGPFAELGHVFLQDGSHAIASSARLSDIGLAYKLRVGNVFVGLQLAHPVGPEPAGGVYSGSTRLLAQVGLQY